MVESEIMKKWRINYNSIKKIIFQFFKFSIVGGIAAIIDIGLFKLLVEITDIYYLIINCIAFVSAYIFTFFLSLFWVFDKPKSNNSIYVFCFYTLLSVIGLGLNEVILFYLIKYINLNMLLSKVVATGVVVIWNFVSRKKFIFH